MNKSLSLIKPIAVTGLLLGSLLTTLAQANTTYTVDLTITSPLNGVAGNPSQTDSVLGSITTDGTIGVLHAGNIVDWTLDLVDVTKQYSFELTKANSMILADNGNVLSADASRLFFNFAQDGAFAFQADSPGAGSGYHYWCLSKNYYACASGNTIAPNNVYAGDPGDDLVVAAAGSNGLVGNVPLDPTSPVVPSVPEPSTYLMLGFGLAGLAGLAAARRKRVRPD